MYPWKIIAYILGSFNVNDGCFLIVQQANENNNIGAFLFQDYLYFLNLSRFDGNIINGLCFALKNDSKKML